MKRYMKNRIGAACLAACLGASCGGGGGSSHSIPGNGGGGGSAIVALGPVEAGPGLTVQGLLYETQGAAVLLNGLPAGPSELLPGHVVRIQGRVLGNGRTVADDVLMNSNVVGPIGSLDPSGGRMTVMGQPVRVDPETVFGPGIDPVTWGGLGVGGRLKVSGLVDAADVIRATRLELDTAGTGERVVGVIDSVLPSGSLFTINQLTLDYGSATAINVFAGILAPGMEVSVRGRLQPSGIFAVDVVSLADFFPFVNAGTSVRIDGLVTYFGSPHDFRVNNFPMTIGPATAYFNGSINSLSLGARLEVQGTLQQNGALADTITFSSVPGTTTTVTYPNQSFDELVVTGPFQVTLTQAPGYQIGVTVDTSALPYLDVRETGGVLHVGFSGPTFVASETMLAAISMPSLERVSLAGATNATVVGFDETQLDVTLQGAATLRTQSVALDALTAAVYGASQLDLTDVDRLADARVDLKSVGRATLVLADGADLRGTASSGSSLLYYGTAVNEQVVTSSGASVKHLGAAP